MPGRAFFFPGHHAPAESVGDAAEPTSSSVGVKTPPAEGKSLQDLDGEEDEGNKKGGKNAISQDSHGLRLALSL